MHKHSHNDAIDFGHFLPVHTRRSILPGCPGVRFKFDARFLPINPLV